MPNNRAIPRKMYKSTLGKPLLGLVICILFLILYFGRKSVQQSIEERDTNTASNQEKRDTNKAISPGERDTNKTLFSKENDKLKHLFSNKALWKTPVELKWDKILHFIPRKSNQDCLQLFTTEPSIKKMNNSSQYQRFLYYYKKKNSLNTKRAFAAPIHKKLTLTYQELALQPWVKTVCEIGFDQGQSALAWLTAKDDLYLHSFDIGLAPIAPLVAKMIRENFPGRFSYHLGSSDMIMPVWAEKMWGKCDIVSIDGAHDFGHALPDFIHMRKMAARKHMIIADDIEYPGVKKTWTLLKQLGIVTEQYRCHIKGIDIDFVIGQYGGFYWEE